VHVSQLAQAYRRAGHKVMVFSSESPTGAPGRLPENRLLRLPAFFLELLKTGPDVIHVNAQIHMLIPALLYNLFNAKARILFNFHTQPYIAPALPGSPPQKPSYSGLSGRIAQFLLNRCVNVVGPSPLLFSDLEKTCRITVRRHVIIPPGVDMPETAATPAACKEKLRLAKYRPVFSTIGVLSYDWKVAGHKMCIEAMPLILEKYPDSVLVVAGRETGKHTEYLKDIADKLMLGGHVIFAGHVASITELLLATDIYLHMALYESTTPMAVLEAMTHGKPIIGVNSGGLPYSLKNGETGLLVPPDIKALAQAAISLAGNPVLAAQLGRNAKAHVLQNHNWDKIAESLLSAAAR